MTPWRLVSLVVVMSVVAAACSAATGDPPTSAESSSSAPNTAPGVEPTDPSVGTATSPERPPATPDVDQSRHNVPLEEIYFDTFDGGAVPLSDSTAELRSRLLDAIPPIDRPTYGAVEAGDWMEPGDLVLGFVAGGQAYAYPFKILNYHEIVNDVLNGVPVLISYCPLCRSAIVYDRRLGDRVLSFGNTSALYESDLVMVDRNTGSYWWQVAGRAIVGPLTDSELDPLPSEVATWVDWASRNPETLVLTRDTGYERPYERDAFATYTDVIDAGRFPFPVGEAARDGRLSPSALVVGVILNGGTRAYPVDDLSDPINDEVGEVPIVLFPTDGGASVYAATLDGERLQFRGHGGDFVDVDTGSVWTSDGIAISGLHRGARLAPIPSRTTFWFAFVGAFPDVEVPTG
jgi:hypothetical protein